MGDDEVRRHRVAIFNLYWSTYGGGEQVAGAIARALADDHEVVLLGPEPIDIELTKARLGVDLTGCGYLRVEDDVTGSAASADFDIFINNTYRSKAQNRAPVGLYYVLFPGPPKTASQQVGQLFTRTLAAATRPARRGRVHTVHQALERRTERRDWVGSYTSFLSDSMFTQKWVSRLWGAPSTVLYPPVHLELSPGAKSNSIASVGRFFDPKFGHCKHQLELVKAFLELERSGTSDWRLELVGGADAASRDYALAVRRSAHGHQIGVHFNAPRSLVRETLAAASMYWHGSGFGEDAERHPDHLEHFGIAVVEAMAAGAVPIVFGAAGPAEIVRHGVDGFHWHTPAELVRFTRDLIADPARMATMAASAQQRATDFSPDKFVKGLRAAVANAVAR